MNYKLLYSNYDVQSGESVVTIGTEIGQFTGKSRLMDEDLDHPSRFFGCEIAELKAAEKYYKAKARMARSKARTLTEFLRDMSQTRSYSDSAYWVKRIKREIARYQSERSKWMRHASYCEQTRLKNIKMRDDERAKRLGDIR